MTRRDEIQARLDEANGAGANDAPLIAHAEADLSWCLAEIERLRAVMKPFADCVFNDNEDVTLNTSRLEIGHYVAAQKELETP